MTFRDELIEAGARAMWEARHNGNAVDFANMDASGKALYLKMAAAALTKQEVHRTTEECPTCGGTGHIPHGDDWQRKGTFTHCEPCKGSGRVPRDSLRLAIVEHSDAWEKFTAYDGMPAMRTRSDLFILAAPDLPEGTP